MHKLAVSAVCLGLALGASCGLGLAQDKAPQDTVQELKKTDPVPPATGQSKPEQADTQEPSTKGPAAPSAPGAFVNGSLSAPGAPTDTQTTPSKHSARNNASDQLPTVAFRLKQLTDDQRHQIYQELAGLRESLALSPGGGNQPFNVLGAEVPADVVLHHLTAVPESVVAKFPALRDASFIKSGADVLIVDARNTQVISVLSAP